MYNDIPLMGRTWMIFFGCYWLVQPNRGLGDKTKQTEILLKCFTQQQSTMFSYTGILGQFSLWLSTGRLSYDPSDYLDILDVRQSRAFRSPSDTKNGSQKGSLFTRIPCPFQIFSNRIWDPFQWSWTSGQVLERSSESSAWLFFFLVMAVMAVMAVWSLLAFFSIEGPNPVMIPWGWSWKSGSYDLGYLGCYDLVLTCFDS